MAWDWIIPQPGPEHLLTLEQQRRAIDAYDLSQAKDALNSLCQLNLHQDLILKSAIRHIAALEQRLEQHRETPASGAGKAKRGCAADESARG